MSDLNYKDGNKQKTSHNPEGMGGFAEHPENINRGGRPKGSITYRGALRNYGNMTPKELVELIQQGKLAEREDITVNEACALIDAHLSLMPLNSNQRQLNAENMEGRAKQTIEHEGNVVSPIIICSDQEHSEAVRKLYNAAENSAENSVVSDDTPVPDQPTPQ